MSKQSEAKLNQGFRNDSPKCSNCGYFSSKKTEKKSQWSSQVFIKESELRCKKVVLKSESQIGVVRIVF